MKATRIYIVALLSVFLLCSCSTSGYRYIDGDGEGYIVWEHSASESDFDGGASLEIAPRIYFSSPNEMVSDIRNGNFTENEKKQLAKFKQDDNGRIVVCDLDDIYYLNLPEDASYTINWYGIGYDYSGSLPNGRINGIFMTETTWSEKLDRYLEPVNSGHYPWAFEEDKNAAVYRVEGLNSFHYRAIYQINNGTTTIHVIEFFDEYPNALTSIHLCCTNGSAYVLLGITPYDEYFSERPSLEYLSHFGIEHYAGE